MSEQPVTVVANVIAKANDIEQVERALTELVTQTRKEVGCICYDLHKNNDNPAHFVVYEIWQSEQALQAHAASAHFQAYGTAVEGMVERFSVDKMTKIA
ncbi:antibiotic biosynthesis monooxygenase [Vibrio cholerae]